MTPLGVLQALATLGPTEDVSDVKATIAAMHCFDTVSWEPQYLVRVDDHLWGIDALSAPRLASRHLSAMKQAQDQCDDFQAAVAVSSPEDAAGLAAQVHSEGIVILYPRGRLWVTFRPKSATAPGLSAVAGTRLPPALVDAMLHLQGLDPAFATVIRDFSTAHRELRDQGAASEDNEAALIRRTLSELLAIDPRYIGRDSPLDFLRVIERATPSATYRDHFFHTIQTFLLGLTVLASAYGYFRDSLTSIFPSGGTDMSVEYVWLLTALFHDIGYTVQRIEDVDRLVYGPSTWEPEPSAVDAADVVAARSRHWDSPTYQDVRRQLVSLFSHCCNDDRTTDWLPEVLPTQSYNDTAFDKAAGASFLEGGHGVAGALKLAADLGTQLLRVADNQRPFLYRHLFLATLSIPFHDVHFRQRLYDQSVTSLPSARFAFAVLLAYLDSIQDDRRELPTVRDTGDVLLAIRVDAGVVRAEVAADRLTPDFLATKQVEAADLNAFWESDPALSYEYPEQYRAMGPASSD